MGHSSASGRSLEEFGGRGQVLIDFFKGTDLDTTSGINLRGTFSLLEPSIPTALHSLDVDSGKSAVLWILIEHSPGAINTINGVFIDR